MLFGGDHARDGERRQRLRLVVDILHLKPDHGELVGEFFNGLVGGGMFLQPGKREFHGCEPRILPGFFRKVALSSLLPPPLWGRVGEGGKPLAREAVACRITSTTPSRFDITCSLVKRRTWKPSDTKK